LHRGLATRCEGLCRLGRQTLRIEGGADRWPPPLDLLIRLAGRQLVYEDREPPRRGERSQLAVLEARFGESRGQVAGESLFQLAQRLGRQLLRSNLHQEIALGALARVRAHGTAPLASVAGCSLLCGSPAQPGVSSAAASACGEAARDSNGKPSACRLS